MHCLLVAATVMEIEPFLKHFHTSEKKNYIEIDLHIMITGVGMMATTYHLTSYLAKKKPDIIIMVGVAGCFDQTVTLGKVFAVQSEMIADMGVYEKNDWFDLFDLKLLEPHKFPYNRKMLENKNVALLKRLRLPKVAAISVNQITVAKKTITMVLEKYHPKIESMEGAALHYVALQENIPFVQIRAVSNYVGQRNKSQWKMEKAILNSNKVLIRLFESL